MADTSTNSWKLLYESGRQALQARKLQEAEQSFSAALQLAEDFPPGDPRLAATLNALARIYSLQRRYLAAAALLNRLLEVTERTLGNNHVQVAGVLTNLAEMYTHLGAAREELELRERVLAIRADDPNADANAIQRLRERVTELRSMLSAQEATVEEEEEIEPLPPVRTSEYSAPIAMSVEPPTVVSTPEPVPQKISEPVVELDRDDSFRLSPATSQLSVAPWPGAVSTGTTPTGARSVGREENAAFVGESRRPALSLGVEIIDVHAEKPSLMHTSSEHGFADMGRDELVTPMSKKIGGRSSLYSIAAGVVLVAGLLAARGFVGGSSEDGVRGKAVNLAANGTAAATGPAPAVDRPAAPAPTPPVDPRMVERLVAERRGDQAAKAQDQPEPAARPAVQARDVIAPRVPAIDMERTLRGIDGAVRAIDQKTKGAADSMSALRLQAPTFSKTKIADPQQQPQQQP